MLLISLLIITSFLSTSCGGFRLFSDKELVPERKVASLTYVPNVDRKLLALHSYYVLAQKNLVQFDKALPQVEYGKLQHNPHYLNLMAVKTNVETIEKNLLELSGRYPLLMEKIADFSKRSHLASLSMRNLLVKSCAPDDVTVRNLKMSDIESELTNLRKHKEFMIYEKNIEHLSHMFETKDISSEQQIDALDWIAQSPDKITERTQKMIKKTPRESRAILFQNKGINAGHSTVCLKH